jgi:hypothetical protein
MTLPAAVIDTDVFGVLFVHHNSSDPRAAAWRERLKGTRAVISFQTRAEVLAGAASRGWGTRRLAETREILDQMPTIRADNQVIDAYATLAAECRKSGHGLAQPLHAGDRWVAACAIAKNMDLLAGDGIYRNAPNLSLLN